MRRSCSKPSLPIAYLLRLLTHFCHLAVSNPGPVTTAAPRQLAPRPAHGPPDDFTSSPTTDRYVYDLYFRDATAAIPSGTGATLEGYVPDEGELVASDDEEQEEEDAVDEDSNGK